MNRKILIALLVVVIILVVLAPILFLVFQKSQKPEITGPNEAEEYQKFINDKTITDIFTGMYPCEDCKGAELTLSLSRESESALEGKFTLTESFLGSSKDVSVFSGNWNFEENKSGKSEGFYVLVFPDKSQRKFERINAETIVEIDENGKRLQENDKDLVLTLLQ